jgi:hypothetical protein
MRHSMRALIGVMLIGCNGLSAIGAEEGSKWWPFGRSRDLDAAQSSTATDSAEAPPSATDSAISTDQPYATAPESEREQRWMISSSKSKISWPRVHMPEFSKPSVPPAHTPFASGPDNPSRNSWVEKDVTEPKPSPMQSMKDGAKRFGQSTRDAWDRTVDALTPGDKSQPADASSRVARRDQPSMWQRMFGTDEPAKKEGPQTVTEFMAQDRVIP